MKKSINKWLLHLIMVINVNITFNMALAGKWQFVILSCMYIVQHILLIYLFYDEKKN